MEGRSPEETFGAPDNRRTPYQGRPGKMAGELGTGDFPRSAERFSCDSLPGFERQARVAPQRREETEEDP
ncbi:hypothetical protein GCM10010517_59080 [Streptosporangium fragile]|uniref:Uncharacterized protein n=1 Tax=Streptosporangium fragile TaxID=46186 RepID=A0ABN3W554_9ACTN